MEHVQRSRVARWAGFIPYVVVSVVHVTALAASADALAAPTKLLLMPLLALGVVWATRTWNVRLALLIAAITLSWLGDGAATFFPFAPTLPMMLLFFGLAHLAYIWLFQRHVAARRAPAWALVFVVWWVGILVVLWPHLGALAIAVAVYGLVLGGTAASAARCSPVIAIGGVFFLASDTLLAFRLFLPDTMPDWTSPLVMLTYCLGQGLIAAGVAQAARSHSLEPRAARVAHG
ncbi:lysoplasmalogenase family protein [Microbacterium sp.]|uniref:lysoplasmalogenase family protein n=1 Tax=Microbacterium sp. TaxID=51671 RepID=UPI003A8E478E